MEKLFRSSTPVLLRSYIKYIYIQIINQHLKIASLNNKQIKAFYII